MVSGLFSCVGSGVGKTASGAATSVMSFVPCDDVTAVDFAFLIGDFGVSFAFFTAFVFAGDDVLRLPMAIGTMAAGKSIEVVPEEE